MSLQYRLLTFYLITTLGYSITGIATFLCIEKTFHSIGYLGIALSLRTLSACVFGYLANHIINKINIRNSFIFSLVIGLVSIVCIFWGFNYHNFFIVLIGLLLIGLPSTLINIFLTIAFKVSSESSNLYRKYSGSRELIFGITRLVACLIAPILIYKFNINIVIFANLLAYFLGVILLVNIDFHKLSNDCIPAPTIAINYLVLQSKDTWIYICQISSSMFLIALIPLLASLDQITITKSLLPVIRESLWSIEAITMILGSSIYLVAKKLKDSEAIKLVLMLNSSLLFLFLFFMQPVIVVAIIMLISMIMMLSFYLFRDDYVLNAGENPRLIEAHAAFSSVMKDLICSISPVVLSYLLINFTLNVAIFVVFIIQIFFYSSYLLFTKKKVSTFAITNS